MPESSKTQDDSGIMEFMSLQAGIYVTSVYLYYIYFNTPILHSYVTVMSIFWFVLPAIFLTVSSQALISSVPLLSDTPSASVLRELQPWNQG